MASNTRRLFERLRKMGVDIPWEAQVMDNVTRRRIGGQWYWYVGVTPVIFSKHTIHALVNEPRLFAKWGSGKYDSGEIEIMPIPKDCIELWPEGGQHDNSSSVHVIWEPRIRPRLMGRPMD